MPMPVIWGVALFLGVIALIFFAIFIKFIGLWIRAFASGAHVVFRASWACGCAR